MSVFNWPVSSKAPFCFRYYFDTFFTMYAKTATIPRANFLIIQLAAFTGIQRWGSGGLKLEGSRGEKSHMRFSLKFHENSKDKLVKDWRIPFLSLFFGLPNTGDQLKNGKCGNFCPNCTKTRLKHKKVKSLKKNPLWFFVTQLN